MRPARTRLLFCAAALTAAAHEPITTKLTWSQEISRIVARRCAGCHHGEPAGPFSLLTYEDARPWAKAIKDEVLNRRMPPWGAVKGFGEFRDDPSLTQDEILRIAEWVEGGAPEGDARLVPDMQAPQPQRAPVGRALRAPTVARPVRVLAIRPLASAADAKITASLPDGRVEPLLWLRNYKRAWRRTFVYRSALVFPRGTKLHAEPDVAFELIVAPGNNR